MTVALVRQIIADPHQFTKTEAEGDGVVQAFQLENAPVHVDTLMLYVDGVLQASPADYIINGTTGIVTFVIAPPVPATAGVPNIIGTYEHSLLADSDIESFLTLNGDNIRRAAADALDTIASSEVLIQKRITMLDLQTDGKAVADSLREHAKRLREQADDELTEDEADGLFDIAEMQFPPFGRIPWIRRPH